MISIIVAVSDDLGIGKDNELLWHISEDLKRFKRLTTGKTVIMGKKTWESLPKRPLPNRKNIVLTDVPNECIDCSITAYSIDDALSKCSPDEEVFIIGGGSIYRQFMPLADRLYITHVHLNAPADIYFPEIDPGIWKITEKEDFPISELNPVPYTYTLYKRKGSDNH
ncbi:MAG TPA: dihydrofolate reductase [Bacteroidales bacterium]|nr:dihydrofolate reductase [Bacteroidales bacterium]